MVGIKKNRTEGTQIVEIGSTGMVYAYNNMYY
jgi:hypothetical protein